MEVKHDLSDEKLLYKFVNETDSEVSWVDGGWNKFRCLLWVPFYELSGFIELFSWALELSGGAVVTKEFICFDLEGVFGNDVGLSSLFPLEEYYGCQK